MSEAVIFKILTQQQWRDAKSAGVFHGAPVDIADGFIHFSDSSQVQATADKHFAGMDGLVLAAVETAGLGAALVYEVSRGNALFPHLYAPLDMKSVLWARPISLGPDGRHQLADLSA